MIEFALVLPLLVLVVIGVFELGRAFFEFIAISNAAREGARIYTFTPDKTSVAQIDATVRNEIGSATLVTPAKIKSIDIACGPGPSYAPVYTDTDLANCPHGQVIQVTVTYTHELLLGAFFPAPLILTRSAEMMKP